MNRYDIEKTNYSVNEYASPIPKATPSKNKRRRKKSKASWVAPLAVVMGLLITVSCVTLGIYLLKNQNGFTATAAASTASAAASEENEVIALSQDVDSSEDATMMLTDVSDVVANAMPSVVSITSRELVSNNGGIYDFFNSMFGGSTQSTEAEEVDSGVGSGTIVGKNDTELLILTSYHVVEDCSSLYVTFNDDTSVDGYIKSAATSYDIAVVAVPLADIPQDTLSQLKIAKLCTEDVEVGDGVIVIGDALGYGQSVVTGIISATNREITVEDTTINVLQTDAAINAGNSGGCMLNSNGEIIGISEAKITVTSVEGMCYAIPIKENYNLIQMLMTGEYNDLNTSSSSSAAEADYLYGYEDDYQDSNNFGQPGGYGGRMF